MASAAYLIDQARTHRAAGDLAAAIDHQEQAIEVLRSDGDGAAIGHALRHLAEMAAEQGNCEASRRSIDEALALYREHVDPASLDFANAMRVEAVVYEACDDKDAAIAAWRAAREHYARLDASFAALGVDGNPGVDEADERVKSLSAST